MQGRPAHVPAQVARGVTAVDHVRRPVIDPHIGHRVDRAGRRNGVDSSRHIHTHRPRPDSGAAVVPDAAVAQIVVRGQPQHGRGRVDRVVHGGRPGLYKFRLALIRDRQARYLAFDGLCPRHLGVLNRILRHGRAWNMCQQAVLRRALGNQRKAAGQFISGHDLPRAGARVRDRKPTASQQGVVPLAGDIQEQIRIRVLDIQQARPRDHRIARFSVGADDLRGPHHHHDLRPDARAHDGRGARFARLPHGLGNNLRVLPGASHGGSPQPATLYLHEPPRGAFLQEDGRVAVDHREEVEVRHRLQFRFSVDTHQRHGCRGEQDVWHGQVTGLRGLGLGLVARQAGQQRRQRQLGAAQAVAQQALEHALFDGITLREARLVQTQRVDMRKSPRGVNLQTHAKPGGTEHRFGPIRNHRYRRPSRHPVPVVGLDLRFIQGHQVGRGSGPARPHRLGLLGRRHQRCRPEAQKRQYSDRPHRLFQNQVFHTHILYYSTGF